MKGPRLRLLLVGAATLVAGLIIFFPARVAYQWFAPPDFQLSGLRGSVWNGSASEVSSSGVYLRDLQWKFRPSALLTGSLGYSITASPPSGFLDANVAVGIAGAVTLTDVNAALGLQSLERTLRISGLRGNASLQLEHLVLKNGFPVAAAGTLQIENLLVPVVDRSPIGSFRAELFTQDSGVAASVEDTGGMIDLAGSLQLLNDRSYRFQALLAAEPNATAEVRQQLQFLGSANDRGQHELRLEGRL